MTPAPLVHFYDPGTNVITYPDLSGSPSGLVLRAADPEERSAYQFARVLSSFWQAVTPPPGFSWVAYTEDALKAAQALSEFWQSVRGSKRTHWRLGGPPT